MRKGVGVALIAVLAIAFLWLILSPEEKGASESAQQAPVLLGIYSSELADNGNGSVVVMQAFLQAGGQGKLYGWCSGKEMQKNALILDHAAAPGVSAKLGEMVASELARCGLSSRKASAEDAASSQDAVVIAPTGAVPLELLEKQMEMKGKNSRLLLLELLPGRSVDNKGVIAEANHSDYFEIVKMEPGGEAEAAAQAARQAIMPSSSGAGSLVQESGDFTVAIPTEGNSTYCRLVYVAEASAEAAGSGAAAPLDLEVPQNFERQFPQELELENGSCRFVDSGRVEKLAGSLSGPQAVLAGKPSVFEFAFPSGSETGRTLRFFAEGYLGKERVLRQEIAGGEIMGGWASRFSVAFPKGGKYDLRVADQFGRKHAAAYVEVLGLSVKPVKIDGSRYEFYAAFGGRPLEGMVSAWLDGGEKKEYYASNGTLVVWAAPAAGRRVMHFEYQGLTDEYGFLSEGGSLAETYVRLGVPVAVFLLAVYFLLRARKKAPYEITFPEFAQEAPLIGSTDYSEVFSAWQSVDRRLGGHGLPVFVDELAAELGKRRNARIDAQSLLRVLSELVQQGRFARADSAFIPSSALSGLSAEQARTLRLVHDLLLERGIAFRRGPRMALAGHSLEIALFDGKKSCLEKIGKSRRVVVFESRGQLEEFSSSLGHDTESVRIKLALGNNHLAFAAATRLELDAVLP